MIEKLAKVLTSPLGKLREQGPLYMAIACLFSLIFSLVLLKNDIPAAIALFEITIIATFGYGFLHFFLLEVHAGPREEKDFERAVVCETKGSFPRPQKIRAEMKSTEGLSLAFVSGKGGVGKTMLAVSAARELAARSSTLMVDLDFYNRGLSGLMGSVKGHRVASIECPVICGGVDVQCFIDELEPNILFLRFPVFTHIQLEELASVGFDKLRLSLMDLMKSCKAQIAVTNIVCDCHGGPDSLSFAACSCVDYSLLISESDRISFHGTKRFVEQIQNVARNEAFDLRLVFNKVLPHFSARFLTKLYDMEIRRFFCDRPLCAIFPLDLSITKCYETTPFLTKIFPYSLLARKTQVMLRDLLGTSHPELLTRSVAAMPRVVLWHRRRTLGKTPWFLEPYNIMILMCASMLPLGVTQLIPGLDDLALDDYMPTDLLNVIIQFLLLWVFGSAFVMWARFLDRQFTRLSRSRPVAGGLAMLCVVLVAHFVPLALIGQVLIMLHAGGWYEWIIVGIMMQPFLWLLGEQAYKVYRQARYCDSRWESCLRAIIVAYSVAVPLGCVWIATG